MIKTPFISLRREITRSDASVLMAWLEDDRVTRYLRDSRSVSRSIEQAMNRTPMPILTHLFNQGGRFLMAYDENDVPVGFVRLVKTSSDCEIVLIVGDHDRWGQRFGSSIIREALKVAFFEIRAKTVVAKIHQDNVRSLQVFGRCGFSGTGETLSLRTLSLAAVRYRSLLRAGTYTPAPEIFITEVDQCRLEELIDLDGTPGTVELEHEMARAIVVPPARIAAHVVTMNSRVVLRMDERDWEVSLVYPTQADEASGKLSVASEIGAAILGYRQGDTVECVVADRTRRILIDRFIYQPEASGDFHL